jgi:hypothetical protein
LQLGGIVKKKYFWWHGKDIVGFFNEVLAAGAENVSIEVRFSDDGKEAFLHVVDYGAETESHHGGYNFSHLCPPDCGNGNGG